MTIAILETFLGYYFHPHRSKDFRLRIASYAVIWYNGKLGIVRDYNNGCFLPGGGIEQNENAAEAILREILEECGRMAKIDSFIGEAIQYFTCSKGKYYKMNTHFFCCRFTSDLIRKPEHFFSWENPQGLQFVHDSHHWALKKILG